MRTKWKVPIGAAIAVVIVAVCIWSCSDRVVDLKQTDKTPPAAITDLRADTISSGAVRLRWTATGDDSVTGQAAAYDIRYSTSEIDLSNWAAATKCVGVPAPKVAGSDESFLANGLQPKTRYHFAAKVADEVPNWSAICDGATALTPDTIIITWARTFGGRDRQELADEVIVVPSGGYLVAGNGPPSSYESSNFYLVRVDEQGDIIWDEYYGTAVYENAKGICTTPDQGFLVAGGIVYNEIEQNVLLIKVNSRGELVWWKEYDRLGMEAAYDITPVGNDTYVLALQSGFLMKVDGVGDSIWVRHYDGMGFVEPATVVPTLSGGFIAGGRTGDGESGGAYLFEVDCDGNLIWERGLHIGSGPWLIRSIAVTQDGGYIATGFCGSDIIKIFLVRVDCDGNVLWDKTYGEGLDNRGYSICHASGGGYVIAGGTGTSGNGVDDVYLFKIDNSGNIIWERTYGGSGSDMAVSIAICPDGGYIVAGHTWSFGNGGDYWLLKLDSEGRLFE
jgi:predicted Rdx family selenoprotein